MRDDRGVAATEAMLVLALLGGVFFAGLLLARWSTSLQSAQMGARLLAFDAGDVEFAKLGKPSRTATQQFVAENWDTLVVNTRRWNIPIHGRAVVDYWAG